MHTPSRRRALQLLAGVGAVAATGAFLGLEPDTSGRAEIALGEGEFLGPPIAPLAGIERPSLTLGYIPITCATPIVFAGPMNFFAKHGLDVELRRYSGWAEIRDAYIAGEIQGAQLLAPIPFAVDEGLGSARIASRLALMNNVNGQAITLSTEHRDVRGPADLAGMTFAVPFEYSMHNFLLRHYLSTGGLDPDRDVRIQVVRPPDMVAQLLSGNIDGYLSPDPFNQRAVSEGVGYIHLLTRDLWQDHPCCGFVVQDGFARENPVTYQALLRAISDSAAWVDTPDHRADTARVVSEQAYLNQPEPVVRAVLTGAADDGSGGRIDVADRIAFRTFPHESAGAWIASQIRRWDLAPPDQLATEEQITAAATRIFDTGAARSAMSAVGLPVPATDARPELIQGDRFVVGDAMRWTARTMT